MAEERDESLPAIAERGGLPRATIYALARPDARLSMTPRRGTLERLAAGLRRPLREVEAAAIAATFGYQGVPAGYRAQLVEVDGQELGVLMPEGQAELDDDEQAEVAETMRELLRRRRARRGVTGE